MIWNVPRWLASFEIFSTEKTSCGGRRLSLSTFASAGCWKGSRPCGSGVGLSVGVGPSIMERMASTANICRPA